MSNFFFCKHDHIEYCAPPFHPNQKYLEFNDFFKEIDSSNTVYEKLRDLFILAEYDKRNIGTDTWNPLRDIVKNNDKEWIEYKGILRE